MFSALLHPASRDRRRLYLRDYEVHINIGAFEHEKRGEQRVVINVDLFVPLVQSTPIDDRLHEVVDYDLMKQSVAQCPRAPHPSAGNVVRRDRRDPAGARCRARGTRLYRETGRLSDCDAVGVEVFRIKDEERA
jgi:dihydroneopterin aldolase